MTEIRLLSNDDDEPVDPRAETARVVEPHSQVNVGRRW